MEFTPFPKLSRLNREMIVTEKIDGTNAQIVIREIKENEYPGDDPWAVACFGQYLFYAGSRNRWLTLNTKSGDNYGFAAWVRDNVTELVKLGVGQHFGEWYGSGILRNYGLKERRFALFNVSRWGGQGDPRMPQCCGTVPTLYRGPFDTNVVDDVVSSLKEHGSKAVPGFMKPEGIVVFHTASSSLFKVTCEKDHQPKSVAFHLESQEALAS